MLSTKTMNLLGLVLLAGAVGACATSSAIWGDLDSGLILEYRMPPQAVFSYETSSISTEKVEVMGQSMQVKTVSSMDFTAAVKDVQEKVQDLDVTIDSSYVSITSPRGELKGDMTEVIGKTFSMQLSPLGKEMNLKGTEGIEVSLGPAGKRNATSSFTVLFADLAGKPVKVGDTWPTKDTIDQSGGGMDVLIALDGVSKLDGVADVEGYACARIISKFSGTVSGKGKQGPMDLATEGTMKGVDTTYFAFRDGFLVKTLTHATIETTTEATGPQNMTIPSTREMFMELHLAKGPTPMAK